MDSVILKDMRGLVAALALLATAACGGGDEKGASATPAAGDSGVVRTAPGAVAAAPGAVQPFPSQPAAAPAAALDSAMDPREAVQAAGGVQPQGPVAVQALQDYQLTMPRIRQLVQGGQAIAALQARRPELRDSMRVNTMDPNLVYQRLNSIPDARAAVESAGLTPREYTVAMAALIQAAMVHEMRRAGRDPEVPVNEANVQFVKDNWEEIQTLMRAAAPRMPAPQP
jgi:hypothetical protein